jgi:hypothetical protein
MKVLNVGKSEVEICSIRRRHSFCFFDKVQSLSNEKKSTRAYVRFDESLKIALRINQSSKQFISLFLVRLGKSIQICCSLIWIGH